MKALRYSILLVLFSGMISCSGTRNDLTKEDEFSLPVGEQQEVVNSPGSLWSPTAKFVNMYADPLAKKVGDIIMVQIIEATDAANEAKSNSKRDNRSTIP